MKNQILQSLVDDFNYLCSKVNWGSSFLDARAVEIMNTLSKRIKALELDPNIYNDN